MTIFMIMSHSHSTTTSAPYIPPACQKTPPSHLPRGRAYTRPIPIPFHLQLWASICVAVTHSDYKSPACNSQRSILQQLQITRWTLGMKSHQGSFSSQAWVTVSPPHLHLTFGFLFAQDRECRIFVDIKIKMVAGGQWTTSDYLPFHNLTHTYLRIVNTYIRPIVSYPPSSICWGWKGFNFRSNRRALPHNVAAYCSHKEASM